VHGVVLVLEEEDVLLADAVLLNALSDAEPEEEDVVDGAEDAVDMLLSPSREVMVQPAVEDIMSSPREEVIILEDMLREMVIELEDMLEEEVMLEDLLREEVIILEDMVLPTRDIILEDMVLLTPRDTVHQDIVEEEPEGMPQQVLKDIIHINNLYNKTVTTILY